MLRRAIPALACVLVLCTLAALAHAQDPGDSADHPPGNVNELTLAGLQPGLSRIPQAVARWGAHWRHPSPDESDIFLWCDARSRVQVSLEARPDGLIRVVNVEQLLKSPPAGECTASLGSSVERTGRGVHLGGSPQRLLQVYGKPFFSGPSSWRGRTVQMIVFNFSWAGATKPQILESSFAAGKLVKMTLSSQYY